MTPMLSSCLSCSVRSVTEEPTCFYQVCCRISSLKHTLHYYIQTLFIGKITGIAPRPWLIPAMLVWMDDVSRRLRICLINFISVFSTDLGEYEDFTCRSALVSKFAAWLADVIDWQEQAQHLMICFFLSERTRDLRWQDLTAVLLPSMRSESVFFLLVCTCWFYFLML